MSKVGEISHQSWFFKLVNTFRLIERAVNINKNNILCFDSYVDQLL